jgi:hypothetical protein
MPLLSVELFSDDICAHILRNSFSISEVVLELLTGNVWGGGGRGSGRIHSSLEKAHLPLPTTHTCEERFTRFWAEYYSMGFLTDKKNRYMLLCRHSYNFYLYTLHVQCTLCCICTVDCLFCTLHDKCSMQTKAFLYK